MKKHAQKSQRRERQAVIQSEKRFEDMLANLKNSNNLWEDKGQESHILPGFAHLLATVGVGVKSKCAVCIYLVRSLVHFLNGLLALFCLFFLLSFENSLYN